MKYVAPLVLFFSFLMCVHAQGYNRIIRPEIAAIRAEVTRDGLPCLYGHFDGYPGHYGAYIAHFSKIDGNAERKDVELMLVDGDPSIRLVGARIAIGRSYPRDFYDKLRRDSAKISVGPLSGPLEQESVMTVSQVLTEIIYDPLFLLRDDHGCSVKMELIKCTDENLGSRLVLAEPPRYPPDLAPYGLSGVVQVRVSFRGNERTNVEILSSSMTEFTDSVERSLSKWKAMQVLGKVDNRLVAFELKFTFSDDED